MLIHSRLDETQTWTGTISKIDTEPASDESNGMYYSDSSGSESSSNYNFYVELDDAAADLILGEHVYLEPDAGQAQTKEGLWLMEGYFVFDGDTAYAWVKNEKERLEKREVTLGEYDSELAEYQIVSGLTAEDYIAWPMASFEEGLNCTTDISKANYEESTDGSIDNMDEPMDNGDGSADIMDMPTDNSDGSADNMDEPADNGDGGSASAVIGGADSSSVSVAETAAGH